MGFAQCKKAHEDSGSPVNQNSNVCAGGETGTDLRMLVIKGLKTFPYKTVHIVNICYNSRNIKYQ